MFLFPPHRMKAFEGQQETHILPDLRSCRPSYKTLQELPQESIDLRLRTTTTERRVNGLYTRNLDK